MIPFVITVYHQCATRALEMPMWPIGCLTNTFSTHFLPNRPKHTREFIYLFASMVVLCCLHESRCCLMGMILWYYCTRQTIKGHFADKNLTHHHFLNEFFFWERKMQQVTVSCYDTAKLLILWKKPEHQHAKKAKRGNQLLWT